MTGRLLLEQGLPFWSVRRFAISDFLEVGDLSLGRTEND
ncbi:hypothetical protein VRK_19530 [Vibrio sp. MEBiC08052]|nr:hypothetical protein VRK_19530 [Vibrio sp. MEBiC08052]